MLQFLLDNMNSLVTLFVGTFAFVVYKLQQRNTKQVAARIIWLETVATEERLKGLHNNDLAPNTKTILRRNSWFEGRHLIISDFDNDEIKLLDDFYNSAETIELARKTIQENFTLGMNAKSAAIQNELMKNIMDNIDNAEITKSKRDNFLARAYVEDGDFGPQNPQDIAKKELSTLRFITASSAATKLKMIAKIK